MTRLTRAELQARLGALQDVAECRHCGEPIVRLNGDTLDRHWFHVDAQGDRIRGCYAASYVNDEGWTREDLYDRRSWSASPTKESARELQPPPEQPGVPPLTADDREMATLIAMHIRNNLEELHGGGSRLDFTEEGGEYRGLTDEQMRWINPIVRNSVADMLHALTNYKDRHAARQLLGFCRMLVPDYWEPAELTDGDTELDWSKP